MKNILTERKKRKKQWDAINKESKFLFAQAMAKQVYGGEVDQELLDLLEKDFVDREMPSIKFIEYVVELEKSGKPYLLQGHEN